MVCDLVHFRMRIRVILWFIQTRNLNYYSKSLFPSSVSVVKATRFAPLALQKFGLPGYSFAVPNIDLLQL